MLVTFFALYVILFHILSLKESLPVFHHGGNMLVNFL